MVEVTHVEVDAEEKIKKPKLSRTRKADMDAAKSLSADIALPEWLNAVFESRIVPTLIDYYGSLSTLR